MVDKELMSSLYVVNKHAKQYAEQATKNYQMGKGATAKQNSVRKKSLYKVKSLILEDLTEQTTDIQIHKIDNQLYYCFIFEDYSFHSPISEHSFSLEKDVEELSGFETSAEKTISRSLKESLLYITTHTTYNPNDYLEQEYVSYPSGHYFIGWSYLD
jgi:hypothetical protein